MKLFINIFSLFSWLIISAATLTAQERAKPADIEATIQNLEKDEANKAEVEVWNAVLNFNERLETSNNKTAEFLSKIANVDEKLRNLEANPFNQERVPAVKSTPLNEVEARVSEYTQALNEAELEAKRLNKLSQSRIVRSGELPGLIANARASLGDVQPLDQTASSGESIERARYQLDMVKFEYFTQLVKELEAELKFITEDGKSLQQEKQMAEQAEVFYSEELSNWTKLLERKLKKEAVGEKEKAEKLLAKFDNIPELKEVAEMNLQLLNSKSGKGLNTEEIQSLESDLEEKKADLAKLKDRSLYSKKRIKLLESSNLTIDQETGTLLRQQTANLPSAKDLKRKLRDISQKNTHNQLKLYELFNLLDSQPNNTEEFINKLEDDLAKQNISKEEVRQLFIDQRALLNVLIKTREEFSKNQDLLTKILNETITESEAYKSYLDQRLMWIASAPVMNLSDISLELNGIKRLSTDQYFAKSWKHLKKDLTRFPVLWGICAVLIFWLIMRQKRLRAIADRCHAQAKKRNCQSIIPTLQGGLLGMVSVLVLPLLFAFLAWRVQATSLFVKPLTIASIFSFLCCLVWVYSRPKGFLHSNFKLSIARCNIIHKTFQWFLPVMLPLIFISVCLLLLPDTRSYARVIFMISSLVQLVALYQLFKPSKNLIGKEKSRKYLAKIIFVVCMIIPSGLIVAAYLGYFSSALLLRAQFVGTIWTVVAYLFLATILRRWFLVSSRRIAIKQALARREQFLLEKTKNSAEGIASSDENPKTAEEVEAEAIDIAEVKEQTTRLVNVALYCTLMFSILGIWSQSISALSVLDRTEIWKVKTEQSETSSKDKKTSNPIANTIKSATSSGDKNSVKADDTSEEMTNVPGLRSISLQDLLVTFVIFILTYVAASNIPGLLEIILFNRFTFKPGAAFALNTTIRYMIVLFGVIWGFSNIGISWANIQWIAAAVTLGIGFGLQEVFANFVAGIILLYERPIRLGDIITVGDVSGRVSEIKIRATTVVQFNNHELIVPNKEFITGQLVNWTLKDNVVRVEVAVGIAYGSDTALARDILLKLAKDHKQVLDKPASDVLYSEIAGSTLNFILRFHVEGIEYLASTKSDLYFGIDNAFREANIEMAFPQLDLHIRSVDTTIPVSLEGKTIKLHE